MSTPDEIVLSYFEHIEDADYIARATNEHGAASLVDAAVRILRDQDFDIAVKADTFIRDVSIGLFSKSLTKQFREKLPKSQLFDVLTASLEATNFNFRRQAVHTLGKLCFEENIGPLLRTFNSRKDSDPLLMDGLLFELVWLEKSEDSHMARVSELAESPAAVCRWSVVRAIERQISNDEDRSLRALLEKLSSDPFPPLRAEAQYWQEDYARRVRNRGLTKEQRKEKRRDLRKEVTRVESMRPPLTFNDLEICFWNEHQEKDYSVTDILNFLKSKKIDLGPELRNS